MIYVNDLTKRIKNKTLLNKVSFRIEKGTVVGLIGPNGAGKTTMIKHLSKLLRPTSGTIYCPESVSYFMGDEDLGFNSITVRRYLKFISEVYKKDLNTELLHTIIDDFKIPVDAKIKHLSRGEKVKLELATVLSRDTEVYLLDEPFNGIDVILRETILDKILTYIDIESKIIIIASHELVDIEKIIDEVILLHHGEVIAQTTVDDIRNNNQDLFDYYKEVVQLQDSMN